jgi:hypothetical protein
MPPRNRERNAGMNDKDAIHRRNERLAQLRKDGEALTPKELAWWKENITALAHTRPPLPLAEPKRKYDSHPPTLPIPGLKLADAWTFDAVQFLKELADVREMILRIPPLPTNAADQTEYYTFTERSRMQSAVDRIWRLEQDLRFFFALHREGQRSFARQQAAQEATAHKGKGKIAAGNVVKMAKFKT